MQQVHQSEAVLAKNNHLMYRWFVVGFILCLSFLCFVLSCFKSALYCIMKKKISKYHMQNAGFHMTRLNLHILFSMYAKPFCVDIDIMGRKNSLSGR